MKKIISLLLSASMLCTGFAFNVVRAADEGEDIAFTPGQEYAGEAYAPTEEINYSENTGTISYSDVSDYSAVGILSALGIVSAAEGGQFKPKAFISRGEFVEAVLKTFKVNYEGAAFGKDGSFYDVDEDCPYYSAIASALSAGFISGYEDNTFRPNEVISYENALACILKALGFSNDYDLSFANRARGYLIKGMNVVEPRAITRMEMAQLLYNALTIPMKNVAQYATIGLFRYIDEDYFENIGDETILNHVWRVYNANGNLSTNYVASTGSDKPSEGSVVISGIRYATEDLNNLDWLGMDVTYYYDDDDNLVYMHKHKKVDEEIIEADDYISFNAQSQTITYYEKGEKQVSVTLDSDYKVFYNGTIPESSYDESIFDIDEGRIRLVANSNGKYKYVFIEEYKNFVLDKFSIDDTKFKFMLGENMTYFTVDTNYTYLEAYSNGARKEIYRETEDGTATYDTSMFEADTIISVYAPYGAYDTSGRLKDTGNYIKIAVSADTVEGTVKSINKKESTKVTIDDTVYNVSNSSYLAVADIQIGALQAFRTDAAGELVILTDASDGDGWGYAYLVHIVYDGDTDYPTHMMVYDSYGSMQKYAVTENLKINKKKIKAGKTQSTLEESARLIGKANLTYQQLIKIKTKEVDGVTQLTEIQTVLASTGVPAGYSDEWLQRNESGKYRVYNDSQSVLVKSGNNYSSYTAPKYFFSVPLTEEKEEKYFDLRPISNTNGVDYEIDLYDIDDTLTPTVAIRYQSSASDVAIGTANNNSSSPVMLRDSWGDLDNDGLPVLRFEVVQAKGIAEYYSENLNLLDDYVPGDVMYLYGNGTKVTSITPMLYNGKCLGPNNLPDVDSTVAVSLSKSYSGTAYFMEIYKVATSSRAIMQNGAVTTGTKREVQTSITDRNREWQMGGVIHYTEENGRSEVVSGSFSQVKEAEQYGSEAATKALIFAHEGGARQIIMFTLDR